MFLFTTTLVLVFKHEVDHRAVEDDEADTEDLDIVSAYKLLWTIVRLKPVIIACSIMLTAKVGLLIQFFFFKYETAIRVRSYFLQMIVLSLGK